MECAMDKGRAQKEVNVMELQGPIKVKNISITKQ
jgi:hypothetical protein